MMLTEDEVRDRAKTILGFDEIDPNVKQGTGQITTFNQLGFKGISDKPDGWYLPNDKQDIAIILETKSEKEDVYSEKHLQELEKNVKIAAQQYKRIVGILYNGVEVRVFKYLQGSDKWEEVIDVAKKLEKKHYYIALFKENKINKQLIYNLTKKINDCLHIQFGIKNLYHRMIITACALVAKRYGAMLTEGMDYSLMTSSILNTLSKSLEKDKKQNLKLELLVEVYAEIKMNTTNNQEAIDNFITWVSEISDCVNSDYWNGEDVMGIFFNEFNRYKKKSESGQIFTPDHITSFMYRLIEVNQYDRVLDATCGSGAFLVKAMCNMVKEAGGVNTSEALTIKSSQLFGIEFDREIFALACANMLIHKDGKTNLEHLDSRTDEACEWIKSKKITKVLMNPPYERKYGCLKIVENVLRSVPVGTKCAFILPDKKLEKDYYDKRYGNKLLKNNTLTTIVKLPENLFFGVGVTTSIFIFESGNPQKGRNIIGYYIEEDGLETVKNQGRQDIKDRWQEKEDYWISAIRDGEDTLYNTRQVINPLEHLSYQMPTTPFEIYEEDFVKTVMDYEMFQRGIDVKDFNERLMRSVLYGSSIIEDNDTIMIKIQKQNKYHKIDDVTKGKLFPHAIKLPIDINQEPDWEYIEQYMKPVEERAQLSINHLHNIVYRKGKQLEKTTWKEFVIEDLFESSNGDVDIQKRHINGKGDYVISAGFANNGIMGKTDLAARIFNEGTITIDMFGNAFYRNFKYKMVTHARVFSLRSYYDISVNQGLFLSTVLGKFSQIFKYDQMCTWEQIKNRNVFLPADTSGVPNWEYMENYMLTIQSRVSTSFILH